MYNAPRYDTHGVYKSAPLLHLLSLGFSLLSLTTSKASSLAKTVTGWTYGGEKSTKVVSLGFNNRTERDEPKDKEEDEDDVEVCAAGARIQISESNGCERHEGKVEGIDEGPSLHNAQVNWKCENDS